MYSLCFEHRFSSRFDKLAKNVAVLQTKDVPARFYFTDVIPSGVASFFVPSKINKRYRSLNKPRKRSGDTRVLLSCAISKGCFQRLGKLTTSLHPTRGETTSTDGSVCSVSHPINKTKAMRVLTVSLAQTIRGILEKM